MVSSSVSRVCAWPTRTGRRSAWSAKRAASVYGEPRLTADVDVVLLLGIDDLAALRAAFPETEYYVPPESVIVRKLEFLREGGSDKHVRDIRFIVAATALDRAFLEQEVARLGLQEEWRRCREDG